MTRYEQLMAGIRAEDAAVKERADVLALIAKFQKKVA